MTDLSLISGRFVICRLPAGDPVPASMRACAFVSITRTADELSIVCDEASAPEGARIEAGWSLLKVKGPIDFSAVGVVASLASPIADAGIGIFVISTFDTDYLLVKATDLVAAADALERAGHSVDTGGTG